MEEDKLEPIRFEELDYLFTRMFCIDSKVSRKMAKAITDFSPSKTLKGVHLKKLPYNDIFRKKVVRNNILGDTDILEYDLHRVLRDPDTEQSHLKYVFKDMMSRLLEYDDHRKAIVDALIAGTHSEFKDTSASSFLVWYLTQGLIYPAEVYTKNRIHIDPKRLDRINKSLADVDKKISKLHLVATDDSETAMHIRKLVDIYQRLLKGGDGIDSTKLRQKAFVHAYNILVRRDHIRKIGRTNSAVKILHYVMACCLSWSTELPRWAIIHQVVDFKNLFVGVLKSDISMSKMQFPEELK
jgi:hypothetical protein